MGQQVSRFPETPAGCTFFCVSFVPFDCVRVIDAPQDALEAIRNTFIRHWTRGIQREVLSESGHSVEFKLVGSPFHVNSAFQDAVSVKIMCCAMLKELRELGWELAVSSDLSQLGDLSALFFQKVSTVKYGGCNILCLATSAHDKLLLLNAPVDANDLLVESVGPLFQRHKAGPNWFEVQLKGFLWSSGFDEADYQTRLLLLRCFRDFHKLRYRFYGSANLKGTTDALFFISDNEDASPQNYFVLSLSAYDRIRVIGAPDDVINTVEHCVQTSWRGGLQNSSSRFPQSIDFKLRGFPWSCGGENGIWSRFLIKSIMQELAAIGWVAVTGLDVSRLPSDKSVFIFRCVMPARVPYFAIAPSSGSTLRVVGVDDETFRVIADIVGECWTPGVRQEATLIPCAAYEFQLASCVWVSSQHFPKLFELCRVMMCRLLYALFLRGWRVVCAGDLSSRRMSSTDKSAPLLHDPQSWFMARTGINQVPQEGGHVVEVPADGSMTSVLPGEEPPPSYEEAMRSG